MTAGRAKVWAEQEGQCLDEAGWYTQTYEELKDKIERLFGNSDRAATARLKINQLVQGSHSVNEYNVDFDQQARLTRFDEEALINFYKCGLNPFVQDKIYTLPNIPNTLDEWKQQASKFDRAYNESKQYHQQTNPCSPPCSLAHYQQQQHQCQPAPTPPLPPKCLSTPQCQPTVKQEATDTIQC
jgi:hypothetical protein